MDYLAPLFSSADFHIQTSPVCKEHPVHLTTGPICRTPRLNRGRVRDRLGIPHNRPMVLITMGGIPKNHAFMDQLIREKGIFLVVPGIEQGFGSFGAIEVVLGMNNFLLDFMFMLVLIAVSR